MEYCLNIKEMLTNNEKKCRTLKGKPLSERSHSEKAT